MTKDSSISNTISNLRFPLTLGVVFIHFSMADGFNYHGVVYGLENPSFFFFVVNLFSEVLSRVCVPLFFFISGFLFFYNVNFSKEIYYKKLKSRARTLLLPFLLWNILAAIVILGKSILPFYPDVSIIFSLDRLWNTLFYNLDGNGIIVGPSYLVPSVASPLNIPLWFVRDLMVMALLSPIHYWMIKMTGILYIVTLSVLWFTSSLFVSPKSYAGIIIIASFFFSWGAYYSIKKDDFVLSFQKIRLAPLLYIIIAIADASTKTSGYNEYIHKTGILLGIISFVAISSLLVLSNIKIGKSLTGSSFFIFALHTLFMGDVGKIVFRLCNMPGDNPWIMLIIYFMVPLFTVLTCYFLYMLLKTHTPKLCSMLVGDR